MTDQIKPSLASISAEVRSYVFDLEQKVEKLWATSEVFVVAGSTFVVGLALGLWIA